MFTVHFGFAQQYLPYLQPTEWEIYDFSTSSGHDALRARDAMVQHAPKNNSQVIDTMTIAYPNNPVIDSKYFFQNLDDFNVYHSRIWIYGANMSYERYRDWNYSADGSLLESYEYDIDPDTSLLHFRKHTLNTDGLTAQIYYGWDTASAIVDSNDIDFGLVSYYYTGMRLDSNTFRLLNGIKAGTYYYYYTGTRFDSIVLNTANGYSFTRNHFSYDLNGNMTKDSVSLSLPGTPSYDKQYVKNWRYLPNGNVDSVYALAYGGGSLIWPCSMKYYYNALNNYDSLLMTQGSSSISYTFTYQPSAFGTKENVALSNFQPYPNPVHLGDQLFLEAGTQSVKLYALDGTLVAEYAQIENNRINIPEQIKQGLYIVQWVTDLAKLPKTQKLIIKN